MSLQEEIDACLAYEVLRHPTRWIGDPNLDYLASFLMGAEMRDFYAQSPLPRWRLYGVLEQSEFFQRYVEATGNPQLTMTWTALLLTHLSMSEAFEQLRDDAVQWHLNSTSPLSAANPSGPPAISKNVAVQMDCVVRIEEFWEQLCRIPGCYSAGPSGWQLYCFLNGFTAGRDWLGLSKVEEIHNCFEHLKFRSQNSYGSAFGAFRVYSAKGILNDFDRK